MSSLIHQAQDKLFKQSLSDARIAQAFFENHLPPDLLNKLDLTTLKLEKHTFIDEAYKTTEADVIYSVRIGKTIAYLYVLCEQQSEVDTHIAFRLLVYTVRIMEMHKKQFPKQPLPLVYPMVVYSGEKLWDAPLDIFPLFGEEERLAREWLFKSYQLLDIQRTSDEELRQHECCGLMEFALKYRKVRDFARFLETLFLWLREVDSNDPHGIFLGKIVLNYVVHGMDVDNEKLFIEKANQYLTTELRGEAMTLAQRFEQQGLEKGIQQGMQQGIQQGIQQGKLEGEKNVLLRLLQRKFGEVPKHYRTRIEQANIDILLEWTDTLIEATSLEEIFKETC